MTKFMKKIGKLFIGGRWYICVRNKNTNGNFVFLKAPRFSFCADPIPFSYKGKSYIFCEQFKEITKKGCIGFFEKEEKAFVNKGIVLERPYHLSYPCVFEHNGLVYMIPETSENKSIELYVSESFPFSWKLLSILLKGKEYVDSTIVRFNNSLHLITYYNENGVYFVEEYLLNIEDTTVTKENAFSLSLNTGRGAGLFFEKDGVLCRPTQNCVDQYGDGVFINSVSFAPSYSETQLDFISVDCIAKKCKKRISAFHTIGYLGDYEIIDVFVKRFDPTYNIGCLLARRKRKKHI